MIIVEIHDKIKAENAQHLNAEKSKGVPVLWDFQA
jgi:hypothetical protein